MNIGVGQMPVSCAWHATLNRSCCGRELAYEWGRGPALAYQLRWFKERK
jgi:hypothetical protein